MGRRKSMSELEDETVWLTQAQMAELFQTTPQNITLHIKNVYSEGELSQDSTCKEYLQVQNEGDRSVTRNVKHYNLDVIIAVGYRVKSPRGTQFRNWATERLREYLVKGFTMNDDLLKKAGGGNYWKELLERIRDIRSSEKVFIVSYSIFSQQAWITTQSWMNPSVFSRYVQNKLHYAVNKQTAAEIIFSRADAEQPYMGMKSFRGEQPHKEDALVAKNYLDEKELAVLNRMVSAFFDLAELHALNHEHIYMRDWLPQVDDFAERYGKGVLKNAGLVSREAAIEKAAAEYRKYSKRVEDLPSAAERDYLAAVKQAQKKLKGSDGGKKE